MQRISMRYQQEVNASSVAIARLGVLVGAMAGNAFEEFQFLPFNLQKASQDSSSRISVSTARIFLRLLKENQLPARVVSAAGSLLDEMIKITGTPTK